MTGPELSRRRWHPAHRPTLQQVFTWCLQAGQVPVAKTDELQFVPAATGRFHHAAEALV